MQVSLYAPFFASYNPQMDAAECNNVCAFLIYICYELDPVKIPEYFTISL